LLKQTRTALPSGLSLDGLVRLCRRFCCGKNERVLRCPQAALSSFSSRSFRRSETALPRGHNHTTVRQADHALRDRARETGKKKSLKPRGELARTFGFRLFFV